MPAMTVERNELKSIANYKTGAPLLMKFDIAHLLN